MAVKTVAASAQLATVTGQIVSAAFWFGVVWIIWGPPRRVQVVEEKVYTFKPKKPKSKKKAKAA